MERPYFVHEKGICDSDDVGKETRIWAFAHVMKGAKVGEHCNIGECSYVETGAIVGNHCTLKNGVSVWDKVVLEDYVFLGPNAVMTNDLLPRCRVKKGGEEFAPTLFKEGATVGANATIVCGVTVGKNAMIGAGSVVTHNVPDHALVYGNPARQHGWVCECGQPLEAEAECECGKSYRIRSGRIQER